MDLGIGLGIALPLGGGGSGIQTVHNEMIGYSLVQLTIINSRHKKYVLNVNGNTVGWWFLYQQADAMANLQQWRAYLHNGGTYEAWVANLQASA